MDDDADELVEVVVATGTGLSWDIPRKEEESLSLTTAWKRGKTQCGEFVLSRELLE